jgi:hypothetical protein
MRSQKEFDRFAYSVRDSLVEDWGEWNEIGEPTGMNIGVAMKIANLAFKHMSFSPHCGNLSRLTQWLHVPWDSRTLKPLREIWTGSKPIPRSPGQGFVDSLSLYQELHSFITGIARESGTYRIIYEFYAWDSSRKMPRQKEVERCSRQKESKDAEIRKSCQREPTMIKHEDKAGKLRSKIQNDSVRDFLDALMQSIAGKAARYYAVTNEFKF